MHSSKACEVGGLLRKQRRQKPWRPRARAGRVDRASLLLAGLVFIVGGLFFAAPACASRLVHSRLQEQGIVVQGTVTGKRSTKNTRTVNYSFFTRDNRLIEGSDRSDGREWRKLEFGGPVTVAYLPSRPETNRVLPRADDALQFGLGIMGAGLVLLAMAAFRWPRRLFAP